MKKTFRFLTAAISLIAAMSSFTAFATAGSTSEQLGTKNTFTWEDVSFGTVNGMSADKYYNVPEFAVSNLKKEVKKLNGFVTIGDETVCIFDNRRGEKNVEFVSLNSDGTYSIVPGITEENAFDFLYQAHLGGFFEFDVWDEDGDGTIDYIHYKPYSIAEINAAEGKSLAENKRAFANHGVVFVDKTNVTGVNAANNDIVVAYVNADANVAEIKEVLSPVAVSVTSEICSIYEASINFSNGAKYVAYPCNKSLENVPYSEYRNRFTVGDAFDNCYFYNERLVYMNDFTSLDALSDKQSPAIIISDESESVFGEEVVTIFYNGNLKDVPAREIIAYSSINDSDTPSTPVDEDGHYDFSKYKNKVAYVNIDRNEKYFFDICNAGSTYKNAKFVQSFSNGAFRYELASSKVSETVNVSSETVIVHKKMDSSTGKISCDVYKNGEFPKYKSSRVFDNVTVMSDNGIAKIVFILEIL